MNPNDFLPRMLLILLAGAVSTGQAGELYRWTDEAGQLHYSDIPPSPEAGDAERLPVPSYTTPDLRADEDPYSIMNQLNRLESYRQNLARERREKEQADREYALRQRELEARQGALEAPPASAPVYGYPQPIYPRPPGHRPGWPDRYPPPRPGLWQPDHPAYRPHPRPPVAVPRHSPAGAGVVLGR